MCTFKLKVDAQDKAVELPLRLISGSVKQNPHMRAFWASTISSSLAFLGCFALAPFTLEVASSIEVCENQLYPPREHPDRRAFLQFEDLRTGASYCRYGTNSGENPIACNEVPENIAAATMGNNSECEAKGHSADCLSMYRPEVLPECVCTKGTECAAMLAKGDAASMAFAMVIQLALGLSLLERVGPVDIQSGMLLMGVFWVASATLTINSTQHYVIIRLLMGVLGASLATCQFWSILMFSKDIVGTANGTAIGWGNCCGSALQICMAVALFTCLKSSGMEVDVAWRTSVAAPTALFVVCAVAMFALCWDMPSQRYYTAEAAGRIGATSWRDCLDAVRDPRVLLMVFQYSACYGTGLAMSNQLATHLRTYFQLEAAEAAALAGSRGLVHVIARPAGGKVSDLLFARFGLRGRIWAQFLALLFEAILLFGVSLVTSDQNLIVAVMVFVGFSFSVSLAEGTSFGMVPFMDSHPMAMVSGLVGAGGSMGAVIAGQAFYSAIDGYLLPFKAQSAYVMFFALLTPLYYWPEHGAMFCKPKESSTSKTDPDKSDAVAVQRTFRIHGAPLSPVPEERGA